MNSHAQQVADLEALTADYFVASVTKPRLKPVSEERLQMIAFLHGHGSAATAIFAVAEYAGRVLNVAHRTGKIVGAAAANWNMLSPYGRVQRLRWFLKQLETMP